jgi:hypothetical protein
MTNATKTKVACCKPHLAEGALRPPQPSNIVAFPLDSILAVVVVVAAVGRIKFASLDSENLA